MTVAELISRLNSFDPTAHVVVRVPDSWNGDWRWEIADEFDQGIRSVDVLEDGKWRDESVLTLAIYY